MSDERIATAEDERRRLDGSSVVRGVRLASRAEGEGALVLWGHGLTNDRWSLERIGMADWAPLPASGRRLLRLDWPGHGESGGRREPGDYTWPSLADDLLALPRAASFLDEVAP